MRASRALEQARGLFTHADFAGCVSTLSISEQELGRHLYEADPEEAELGYHLLARVNLWLGTCQWAAGDTQTAAAAFVRSAQLPSGPAPDPKLLPPALIQAYRLALAAPRQDLSCTLMPPLVPDQVLVDGKGPTMDGATLRVPSGTHYLTLRPRCASGQVGCEGRVGQPIGRSLRLEALPPDCMVQSPASELPSRPVCVSPAEASDPLFVEAVTVRARVGSVIVAALHEGRLSLRLMRRGRSAFSRQLVSTLDEDPLERALARGLRLLLASEDPLPSPAPTPWYRHWWVWTLAGAVLVITATTVALAAQNDRVTVVFGP